MIRAREWKVFESNKTFSAARMVKAGATALKAVVPGISKSAKDRELLEEDLEEEEEEEKNWMPRSDGEALGATNGRPGGGAAGRER